MDYMAVKVMDYSKGQSRSMCGWIGLVVAGVVWVEDMS
jgi:hypothetical protein